MPKEKKRINTGIDALDAMLGAGIRMGSTVLLRGGPGTGKTTLALQIIKKHSEQTQGCAVLISLEKDPQEVVEYANTAFGFGIKLLEDRLETSTTSKVKTPSTLLCISRKEVEETIRDNLNVGQQETEPVVIGDIITDIIGNKLKPLEMPPVQEAFVPTLIVVDSLNTFASIILKVAGSKLTSDKWDMRDALRIIWDAIQDYPREAVLILTGEHDPSDPKSSTVASESYFCDVDIQLVEEPVVSERAVIMGNLGPCEPNDCQMLKGRKGSENRFFCRVLKSRSGPRQARRCAYDIVKDEGLRFYEIYPGDGQIMLFAENAPQRIEWNDFISQDVLQMYLYPALDVNVFDRSGLQRTFASLRRFLNTPERTNMYISSFDTYWVNWYIELCQRLGLVRLLQQQLRCCDQQNRDLYRSFCRIVGKVHRVCAQAFSQGESSVPIDETREIHKSICKPCDCFINCAYQTPKDLQRVLDLAYNYLKREEAMGGLLHPVEWKDLRLFGERRSPIIEELDNRKATEAGPPYIIPGSKKRIAVPYNANISFVVYRKDLLQYLRGGIKTQDFSERVKHTFTEIEAAVKEAIGDSEGRPSETDISEAVEALTKEFAENVDYQPQTWEEVIALCELGAKISGKKYRFFVETGTFDTIACTVLELIWSTGRSLKILPDYTVCDRETARETLFRAFYLLNLMFQKQIILPNSSLEPKEFVAQSSKPNSDWLFARHWYSTFVDVLTATRRGRDQEKELVWNPAPQVRLDIMPIPVTLSWYSEQRKNYNSSKATKKEDKPFYVEHVSCWGEWYLGIMKGTENEKLAIDLINNLMSSRKVCERAFSCAALPTVKDFYTMYGEARCFNLPQRDSELLPDTTYKEVSDTLFQHAKSRAEIFDYRHCTREFLSVLEYVRTVRNSSPKDLGKRVDDAIKRIEALGDQEILVTPTQLLVV